MPAKGYSIHISPWGYILAPFKGISLYFSLASAMKSQLISWLSWLIFLYILSRAIKFKQARRKAAYAVKSLLGILKVIFSFLLLIAYVLFVPLPPQSLETGNSNEVLIDEHSHTTYSHDGLATPEENIRYHLGHGFKAWFVTDHGNIKGAMETAALAKKKYPQALVLKGMEISKQGQNLLLLGIKREITSPDLEKKGPGFVNTVHKKYAGVVIVPHWWGSRAVGLQTLADWGVDGFEIFGHASSPLKRSEQKAIIAVSQKNGLLMLGGSNYHGWVNTCDVWTSLQIKGWAGLRDNQARKKAILTAFRKRESGSFKVIVYGRREPLNRVSSFFTPFVGAFFYFSSLNGYQVISWLIWSILIYFLFRKSPRLMKNIGFLIMGIFLLSKGIILHIRWEAVSSSNNILPGLSQALLIISALSLLIAILGLVHGQPRKSRQR